MSNQNQTAPMVQLTGDNRLTTTSLAIAEHFNKSHDKVLRAIRNLECSQEFRRANFGGISLKDQYRRDLPAFEITRDGFVFLAMGFTGRQAAVWKEKYINAFNQLEQEAIEKRALEIPAFVRKKMLDLNPTWQKILHYKNKGLKNVEVAKLLDLNRRTIGGNLRKMEQFQIIEPPKDLLNQQINAKHLIALNSKKGGVK